MYLLCSLVWRSREFKIRDKVNVLAIIYGGIRWSQEMQYYSGFGQLFENISGKLMPFLLWFSTFPAQWIEFSSCFGDTLYRSVQASVMLQLPRNESTQSLISGCYGEMLFSSPIANLLRCFIRLFCTWLVFFLLLARKAPSKIATWPGAIVERLVKKYDSKSLKHKNNKSQP